MRHTCNFYIARIKFLGGQALQSKGGLKTYVYSLRLDREGVKMRFIRIEIYT